MPEGTVAGSHAELVERMRAIADQTAAMVADVNLLFVTNLQQGELTDVGPEGLLNTAQHYTRRQAEEMIRSFQNLGLTVDSFFSEVDFIRAVTSGGADAHGRHQVVFTTAEGGSGSGRRALIPAFCNLLGLPVLNSGAHACSIARHKFHGNAVLRRVGVRVPETWQFGDGRWTGDAAPPNGSKVIVKPTYESMCIGIGDDSVQLVDSGFASFVDEKSRSFGQPVVVQEFVTGEEVGVPIARLGRARALPPMRFLRANGEPYGDRPKTFEAEVLEVDVSHAPFEAPESQYVALQQTAMLAFDTLEMSGVGRIDFRIDPDGRAWVFDTNESPPPLSNTSYAKAMAMLGFPLDDLLLVWLGICLLDHGLISGV